MVDLKFLRKLLYETSEFKEAPGICNCCSYLFNKELWYNISFEPSLCTNHLYLCGPGTSPVALKHTEHTLKKMLHQQYTLQKIGAEIAPQ